MKLRLPAQPADSWNRPASAIAGVPYISTVTVTDRFYNMKVDITPQIQMITSHPFDEDPAAKVVNGATALPDYLRQSARSLDRDGLHAADLRRSSAAQHDVRSRAGACRNTVQTPNLCSLVRPPIPADLRMTTDRTADTTACPTAILEQEAFSPSPPARPLM